MTDYKTTPNNIWAFLQKPPFVGLTVFMAVFLVQMLGHVVMIWMEKILATHDYWYSDFSGQNSAAQSGENFSGIDTILYLPAFILGFVGVAIIIWGVRRNQEVSGTWAGFIGASLLWTGWVEFSLHYHARYFGVKALCEDGNYGYSCIGGAATKPEYFLMQGSVGFLLAIMLFFVLNKESRCNMFRWMHKHLHMNVGKPSKGLTRNFANIVAIETITILWFFYVYLMLLYDPVLVGERHWLTYTSFGVFGLWSLYLIQRLLRFKRAATALRYAIPTAIIFYNMFEIGGRWAWYREFWVHPFEHPIACTLVALGTIAFSFIAIKSALHKPALTQ